MVSESFRVYPSKCLCWAYRVTHYPSNLIQMKRKMKLLLFKTSKLNGENDGEDSGKDSNPT